MSDTSYGHDEALLLAIENNAVALNQMREEVKAQRTFGKRNRTLVRLALVSVIFDIVLSLLLGAVAFQARRATSIARVGQNNLRVLCEAGNEQRAQQRLLWDNVLRLSEAGRALKTPEQQELQDRQTAEFTALIDQTFAQRDCEKATKV